MQFHRHVLVLLFSLVFIFWMNTSASACWCRTTPPVLDEFERAKLVVVAKVEAADDSKAVVVVERVFKGKIKVGDRIDLFQGQFNDCVIGFGSDDVGHEYLFYLKKPKETAPLYEALLCGRSNKLERAFDDMAYLNNVAAVRGKTRLSGFFEIALDDRPNLEGLTIGLKGKKKSYSLKTDSNGFFEIYDLPSGEYVVEPEMPVGWHIDQKYMFGVDDQRPTNAYRTTVKADRHNLAKIRIIPDNTKAGAAHD